MNSHPSILQDAGNSLEMKFNINVGLFGIESTKCYMKKKNCN